MRCAASVDLPMAFPLSSAGRTFYFQVVVLDPKAKNGATCTNALSVQVGR